MKYADLEIESVQLCPVQRSSHSLVCPTTNMWSRGHNIHDQIPTPIPYHLLHNRREAETHTETHKEKHAALEFESVQFCPVMGFAWNGI